MWRRCCGGSTLIKSSTSSTEASEPQPALLGRHLLASDSVPTVGGFTDAAEVQNAAQRSSFRDISMRRDGGVL